MVFAEALLAGAEQPSRLMDSLEPYLRLDDTAESGSLADWAIAATPLLADFDEAASWQDLFEQACRRLRRWLHSGRHPRPPSSPTSVLALPDGRLLKLPANQGATGVEPVLHADNGAAAAAALVGDLH
eukprot:2975290-Pyramimonas_sp.AAC.1